MAEFFGDLKRLAADLYPYRWPILLVIVAVVAGDNVLRLPASVALGGLGAQAAGDHRRQRPLLVLAGFLAWDLGSPLFLNKTVGRGVPLRLFGGRASRHGAGGR